MSVGLYPLGSELIWSPWDVFEIASEGERTLEKKRILKIVTAVPLLHFWLTI